MIKKLFFLLSLWLAIASTGLRAQSPGNCLALDGVANKVSIGTLAASTPSFSGGFSFAAWVQFTSFSDLARVFTFATSSSSSANDLMLCASGSTGLLMAEVNQSYKLTTTTTLSTGTWYFVTLTVNSSGTGTIYINGSSYGTGSLAVPANVARSVCYLGNSNYVENKGLNGRLDEVSIWSKALTSDEIKAIMGGISSPSTATGLVSYYKFNQGTAAGANTSITSITDEKGSHNGTPVNMVLTSGNTTSNFVSSDYPYITLAATSATMPQAGPCTQTTSFTRNSVAYSTSSSATWLTVSPASGTAATSGVTLTFTAEQNKTASARSATVTVSGARIGTRTITVTQPAPTLTVGTTTIAFADATAATAGTTSAITSNTTWSATSSDTWLTPGATSGNGDATLSFIAAKNTTQWARSATVTVSDGGNLSHTITVTQPAPYLAIGPNYASFGDALAGTVSSTTNLASNTSWTATSDATWLSMSQDYGSGSVVLSFTATEQNTTATKRTAIITVTDDSLITKYIGVDQPAPTLIATTPSTLGAANGSTGTVDIYSNTTWTASCPETWLSLGAADGSKDASLSLTASANTEAMTARTVTLTITPKGGTAYNVTVTQGFPGTKPTGSGTNTDPYQIANLSNLCWLSQNSAYWASGTYYVQTADIDATDTKNWNNGAGFIPIGNSSNAFYATYNGQGYTISNLYINRTSTIYSGLFGWVNSATIQNLSLTNCDITGGSSVGGMVGYAQNSTLTNCLVSGKITGNYYTGGIASEIYGATIANCASNASVNGNSYTGGLIGFKRAGNSNIQNSYATGKVTGNYISGGLLGYMDAGTLVINNCYASGAVSGTSNLGGLIGYSSTGTLTLTNSFYNKETFTGSTSYGTGLTTAQMKALTNFTNWDFVTTWGVTSTINNGYPCLLWQISNKTTATLGAVTTGTITQTTAVVKAGIPSFGLPNPYQTGFCYSATNTKPTLADAFITTGGIAGDAIVSYSYIEPVSGQTITTIYSISDTISGLAQGTNYYVRAYATSPAGTAYSDVLHFVTPKGSGIQADPYQIATLDDLRWLSENSNYWSSGTYYIQTADIDATDTKNWNSGAGFSPIGNVTTKFQGQYNGQNHAISNLYINRSSSNYIGLFGLVDNATIRNLNLANCDITGYGHVGGLVGNLQYSTLSNCMVSGKVTGDYAIGGIVGSISTSTSTIANCGSEASVNGNYQAGGVTGYIDCKATIQNSYATGSVTGTSELGGLVGYVTGYSSLTLTNCYATGSVTGSSSGIDGLVGYNSGGYRSTNCYYNNDTFTGSTSYGTGLSTAQMKTISTFTPNWDFATTWAMSSAINNGYPCLLSQVTEASRTAPAVSTQAVSGISGKTAVLNANLTSLGEPQPYKAGFCWSATNTTPGLSDNVYNNGGLSATGTFSGTASGLGYNTTYYVRAYAVNTTDTVWGGVQQFTSGMPPLAVTMKSDSTGGTLSISITQTVNQEIYIDWGDGTLVKVVGGGTYSGSYTAGNTIKIYAKDVTHLKVDGLKLTSLDVNNSTALTYLDCSYNQLSKLDLSNNTVLTSLICYVNRIETLDICKNTELVSVNCSNNLLSKLDLSKNTALTLINCSNNQVSKLDVSKNMALSILYCSTNYIDTLDVSNNTELFSIYCSNNKLSKLDLSKNTALSSLVCTDNFIETLDVSQNTALNSIDCNNNRLHFGTLPARLEKYFHNDGDGSSYEAYSYAPQARLAATTTNGVVDLRSQYGAVDIDGADRVTQYTWLTTAGDTLHEGVDYSEIEGTFFFRKTPADSVYCTLYNAAFPNMKGDSTLRTVNLLPKVSAASELPVAVSFVSKAEGELTFSLNFYNEGIIYIDWGKGTLDTVYQEWSVGPRTTTYVAGDTVKVYAEGLNSVEIENSSLTWLDVSHSTALTILECESNQLTALDLSKNTALTDLSCESNQLTALDLSKNTALTNLFCYENQLDTLDLSQNKSLKYLDCYSNNISRLQVDTTNLVHLKCYNNKLAIGSLPKDRSVYHSGDPDRVYIYAPQQQLAVAVKNGTIDLSSQLTALDINGVTQTTVYNWYTKDGTFFPATGYTENNGVFTFTETPADSVYCTMTNAAFPDLNGSNILRTANLKVEAAVYYVAMVGEASGALSFKVESPRDGTCKVDWGTGTTESFALTAATTATISTSAYEAGDTIRVYANIIDYLSCANMSLSHLDVSECPTIASLHCSGNQLTSLDVSGSPALYRLYCQNNHLTSLKIDNCSALKYIYGSNNQLASLDVATCTALTSLDIMYNNLDLQSLPKDGYAKYDYNPQNNLAAVTTAGKVDLSKYISVTDNSGTAYTTQYVWFNKTSGTALVEGSDYTATDGVFTFIENPSDSVYCAMFNPAFADFAYYYQQSNLAGMRTVNLLPVGTSPSTLRFGTLAATGSTFGFSLTASADNTPVEVDFGDGTKTSFVINSTPTRVEGTLAGQVVKLYGQGITGIDVKGSSLYSLVTTTCTSLTSIACDSNSLNFTSLPAPLAQYSSYTYANQAPVKAMMGMGNMLCFDNLLTATNAQGTADTTHFAFYLQGGTRLIEGKDYTFFTYAGYNLFYFLGNYSDSVYCTLTNDVFPGVLLRSVNYYIEAVAPYCSFTTLNEAGSSITVKGSTNASFSFIDFGDGVKRIEAYPVTGTLASQKVLIYDRLKNLDVSGLKITSLSFGADNMPDMLDCRNNHLGIGMLPNKELNMTSYLYAPQLPVEAAPVQGVVDLSSQYDVPAIADGNKTVYTWITLQGDTLKAGTDYVENQGVFIFANTPADSVYCTMTNADLPDFTGANELRTVNMLPVVPTTPDMFSFVSQNSGTFSLGFTSKPGAVSIDWGTGVAQSYTQNNEDPFSTDSYVAGDTVKVYATSITRVEMEYAGLSSLNVSKCPVLTNLFCSGNSLDTLYLGNNSILSVLYCNENSLRSLDLGSNSQMKALRCRVNSLQELKVNSNAPFRTFIADSNRLTFNTLPVLDYASIMNLNIENQADIEVACKKGAVDLSSQNLVYDNAGKAYKTTYTWYSKSKVAALVVGTDYTESNGVFTFINEPSDSVYCTMVNPLLSENDMEAMPYISLRTKNLKVTVPLQPVITWANPAAITYGTALSATQLNTVATYNGNAVDGTFTYSPALGTVLNAGNGQTLTVSFVPSGDTYADVSKTITIDVAKATLTVTATNATKVYGSVNPALTFSYEGFVNGETKTALTAEPVAATTAVTTSNAGDYAITVSGGAAANYSFAYVPATLSVIKAPLTVTANSVNAVYGDVLPTFGYSVNADELKNDDASSVVTGTASYSSFNKPGAGMYDISISGLTAENYELSYVSGKLNVSKALLTITALSDSVMKGESKEFSKYTITGFKYGETTSAIKGLPALFADYANANVGDIVDIGVDITSVSAANYDFALQAGKLYILYNTAIDLLTTGDVKVYPNPVTSGNVTITLPAFAIGSTITITTLNGLVVLTKEVLTESESINVNSLSDGTYFLKIETRNGSVVKQIVKL